jgi:hypothetical protein
MWADGVTVRPGRATGVRFFPLVFPMFLPSIVSIFCNPSYLEANSYIRTVSETKGIVNEEHSSVFG